MIGNKSFDIRTNRGGEVSLKEGGRHEFVAALDFASMYPYVSESFNIDSSAIVPIELIEEFKKNNQCTSKMIHDVIGYRERLILSNGMVVEQLYGEFKNDVNSINREINNWNTAIDTGADIIALNQYRFKLANLCPNLFETLGLPERIEVHDVSDSMLNDNVLIVTSKYSEIASRYNNTSIPKRKWNALFSIDSIEAEHVYASIYNTFKSKPIERLFNGQINYKRTLNNLRKRAVRAIISRDSSIFTVNCTDCIVPGTDIRMAGKLKIELLRLKGQVTKYICPVKITESPAETSRISVYTLQSERDNNRQIKADSHWALKEIYNHFFRKARNDVKRELKSATSYVEKLRLNSLQNAIKVLMNSEYGASGASFFPFYNPVIPSMTTYAARSNIHFLTRLLEQEYIWIDEQFFEDNFETIDKLISCNLISNVEFADELQTTIPKAYYNCLARCINKPDYLIHIKPSKIIYQDTDSNYYIVPTLYETVNGKLEWTPEGIKNAMHCLIIQNSLYIQLVDRMINRPPGGVNFEHAFIVCRHFNAKKKYYGISYSDSMISNCPEEWKQSPDNWNVVPGISTYPNPDGSFFILDTKKLLRDRIDYFSYAKQQNIKATGVDLARRDQYKFVNLCHLMVIQQDLRLVSYNAGKWIRLEKQEMSALITNIMRTFSNIWDKNPDISTISYELDDFVKTINNNPDKKNKNIEAIRNRLLLCGRVDMVPKPFEHVRVVVLNSADARKIVEQSKALTEIPPETLSMVAGMQYINKYEDDGIFIDFDFKSECIGNLQTVYELLTKQPLTRMINNVPELIEYVVELGGESIRPALAKIIGDHKIAIKKVSSLILTWQSYLSSFIAELNDKSKSSLRLFRVEELSGSVINMLDQEYYKQRLLKGLSGYLLEERRGKELTEIYNKATDDSNRNELIKRLKDGLILDLIKEYKNSILSSKLRSSLDHTIKKFNSGKYNQFLLTNERIVYLCLYWKIDNNCTNNNAFYQLFLSKLNIESVVEQMNRLICEYNSIIDSVAASKGEFVNEFRAVAMKLINAYNHWSLINCCKRYKPTEKSFSTIYKAACKSAVLKTPINLIESITNNWYIKPNKPTLAKMKQRDAIYGSPINELENAIMQFKPDLKYGVTAANAKIKEYSKNIYIKLLLI